MASTSRSDLINPDILAEEVAKGFAGMNALDGTGVVTVNPGLAAGSDDVGNPRTIPYFESIGEAEEVAEGGALSPVKMTMSSEQGTVVRFGKAVSIGGLARRAKGYGRDIYEVARDAILRMISRKLDGLALDRLVARAVAGSMVYDGSSGTVSPTSIVGTYKLFGDEIAGAGDIALWVMPSKVLWDTASISDSTGRSLYTPAVGDRLATLNGVQTRMSDKSNLLVSSTNPQQYYSLLCKRGAVAAWINESVTIEMERDSLADADIMVVNAYAVVHAYGVMAEGTKPGVAAMKTR